MKIKINVGNKNDLHWAIDGEYVKLFKPIYFGNKEKVSEEFRIYDIRYIEMYWVSTQMTGTVSGQQAHVACFRVVTDSKNYEFPCNTGVGRESLLEAIKYFQSLNIEIKDEYHLIEGFNDENIRMWDYIQNLIEKKKNKR